VLCSNNNLCSAVITAVRGAASPTSRRVTVRISASTRARTGRRTCARARACFVFASRSTHSRRSTALNTLP
jgi:hypothetical protein